MATQPNITSQGGPQQPPPQATQEMPTSMDSSDQQDKPQPIIHVRADSDSTITAMFEAALKPTGSKTPLQVPMRMRNLPPSFWDPSSSLRSKSPSVHSRESSLDNTLQDQPYSPQSGGSPQPQKQPTQSLTPHHTRTQSSPATLQQTQLSLAGGPQQQQQQQQSQHLRLNSYDVTEQNLGPLPPGWEVAKTPNGQLYFMNHITKTTQWEDPRIRIMQQMNGGGPQGGPPAGGSPRSVGSMSPQPPQQFSMSTGQLNNIDQQGPLPQGWEKSVTPEGEVYFINHVTKTTTWFDPRLPSHNQRVPIRQDVGATMAQKRQQNLRLERLEKERQILQQRQAELKKFMEKTRPNHNQESMQTAMAETQQMLMRHNIGDCPTNVHTTGMDPFLGSGQNGDPHIRQESADSGLGMGSNFNLGSIPEDIPGIESMDTDLNSTLTENNAGTPTAGSATSGTPGGSGPGSNGSHPQNMDSDLIPSLTDDLGDALPNEMLQDVQTLINSNSNGLTWL